jgi:hypothetical protein
VLVCLLLLLLPALGCGRNDIVPVSGQITLDGQPLAEAVVVFQPMRNPRDPDAAAHSGMGSVGRTDAAGRYRLRLVEPDREGALVGRHSVTITTAATSPAGDDSALPEGERVPREWRDGSQRFEVPPQGTSTADFELTSP